MKNHLPIFATLTSAVILAAACTPSNTPENVETSETTFSLNQAQLVKLDAGTPQAASEETRVAVSATSNEMSASRTTTESQIKDNNADATTASEGETFAWTPSDGDVIDFKVLRKGNDFGYHRISFTGDANGEMTVRSQVSLKAGLGPITVYRYELDTTETWKDGVLIGLDGTTNSDGDDLRVTARVQDGQLKVEGTKYTGSVELGIIPSSHWNIAQVDADRMLSTEDGELIQISGEEIGADTVTVAGEALATTQYRINADIDLDLWYDDQSRLVKLAFETQGQNIEYVLTGLY